MEKFIGKWQVISTENMANMLQAFDMPEEKKKTYSEMKFQMEYQQEGDSVWVYNVCLPNGSIFKTIRFKIGEDFDSTTFDGRAIVSHVEFDGNKLVETHNDVNDASLSSTVVREIVDDQLIVSATVRNVTSVTKHTRIW